MVQIAQMVKIAQMVQIAQMVKDNLKPNVKNRFALFFFKNIDFLHFMSLQLEI